MYVVQVQARIYRYNILMVELIVATPRTTSIVAKYRSILARALEFWIDL